MHLHEMQGGLEEGCERLAEQLHDIFTQHSVPEAAQHAVAQSLAALAAGLERPRNRAFKSALAIDGTLERLTEECDAVAELGAVALRVCVACECMQMHGGNQALCSSAAGISD